MSRRGRPAPALPRRGPGRRALVLRAAVSLALLAGLAAWLDAGAVASRLASMRPSWVLAALAVSVAQVAVLAWRWSFTARRLAVRLPWRVAWREYYLSIFLNQVLPGGVLGDVARAWRQARSQIRAQAPGGPAVRAVVFERLSAQAVMTTVAGVSLFFLPLAAAPGLRPLLFGAGLAAVALVAALAAWTRRQPSRGAAPGVRAAGRRGLPAGRAGPRPAPPATISGFGSVLAEVGAAHLTPGAFAAQLASAAVVVATYLATFVLAARAVGVETPLPVLLPLVAPVLMSMLIPVTVAGWGLREGAAAVLWGAAGLTAADGVAVSVAYGLLVLAGSAPGALFLAAGLRRGRSSAAPRGESAQVEVEQHVVAEREAPARRAQGAVERRDRRQGQGVAAGADDQRRDGDVEAGQHAGLEEP